MTAKNPKSRLNRQILEEAADWFVEFRVGDADSTAHKQFDQWLRRSPEHIRAYMEIANTFVVLPALSQGRKVDVRELIMYARTEGNVLPFDHSSRTATSCTPLEDYKGAAIVEAVTANTNEARRSRRPRFVALAASVTIACVGIVILSWLGLRDNSTYSTELGERRSIILADGSTIDLNARSTVRVNFQKSERDVELVSGQALFEVAKDTKRPFVVRSGGAVVRAVGTQFDVYRKRSGTTITVVEGRVAVYPTAGTPLSSEIVEGKRTSSVLTEHRAEADPTGDVYNGAGMPAVFVSAGEQVTVTGRQVAQPKRMVTATTAWTQHRLVFDGSPLGDVVDDFNRYNRRQLVIDDHELDDFHISGVYSSTDPASLIRFLRQQPGINVTESDEGVRIARK